MVGLIALLFIVSGGIIKAFMDLSSEGNLPYTGKFWSKEESWKNKWKVVGKDALAPSHKGDHWWYLGIIKPKYKERFPFSSTILVFTTDFWHLAQFFFLKSIILGAFLFEPISGNPLIDFALIYCAMLIPFELTYSFIKNRNKSKKL